MGGVLETHQGCIKITSADAQESDPEEQNLIRNADFDQAAPWGAPQRQALVDHGTEVLSERFPASWSITSHGKELAGARVEYRTSKEGPDWARSRVRIENRDPEQPIALYSPAMIPVAVVRDGGYCEARVRARGSGTIALGAFEYSRDYKTKGTGAYCGSALWQTVSLTDSWQTLRTVPFRYEPEDKVGAVCFRMDIHGEVEIAQVFFGHVPPIDRNAQLAFWLPFERSMEAGYARGTTLPYENAYANAYVDGVAGLAGRFERKPGPHPTEGWYQFSIGGTYFDESNIPRDRGTVELWFRPHREILTYPAWRDYYLWAVDRARGPALYMRVDDEGALTLNLNESVISFAYPSGERITDTKTTSCDLPADDTFFEAWHHVAFTYDTKTRGVYLDGNRIISMDAPKSPCMTAEDLSVGWGGRWGPWTPCSDLDEFKVYDRVRYLDDFTPEEPAAPVAPPALADVAVPAALPALALDGPPRVEGDRLLIPLAAGEDRFEATVEIADGLPYIISSKGIKLGLKDLVEEDPPIVALPWADAELLGSDQVRARLERYGASVSCGFTLQDDRVRMALHLEHGGGSWCAPLEVRVKVRHKGEPPWSAAFDGTCSREFVETFRPFRAEGLANIFPVNAAWGNGPGLAMAFAPHTILSYLRQGMVSADEMETAWRTVLDPGQQAEVCLDLYTFDPRYGGDDAVARYHERYPEVFSPDPQVDPRDYRASAVGLVSTTFWMPYTHKPEKKPIFSAQELCRRANAEWEWFYGTGTSAGNWSIEPFLLEALPDYRGKFGAGADPAQQKQWRLNKFEAMENMGIGTGFYILTWMERRYARYFRDSLIAPLDTCDATAYLDNWWTSGMRDYIFMPSWSSAGEFMRKQVDDILRENPPLATFCYDVAERDHRDRADRSEAAGARGFDEKGVFTAHLAAMGELCDY
ncbi:MAG: hypothetical protein QM473_00995, partial [Acidobacteriota bacterium]|nr:hypothetical protein [Acidobacteriota bacterium]